MKKFILIRHGSVIKKPNITDNLTYRAIEFSKNLPHILSENGFVAFDKIYFDQTENNKRCHNTIKNIIGEKIGFDKNFKISTILTFEEEEKNQTYIICYRLESLEIILNDLGININKFLKLGTTLEIINNESNRPNFLYEYIFVVEVDGKNSRVSRSISTRTFEGDK